MKVVLILNYIETKDIDKTIKILQNAIELSNTSDFRFEVGEDDS